MESPAGDGTCPRGPVAAGGGYPDTRSRGCRRQHHTCRSPAWSEGQGAAPHRVFSAAPCEGTSPGLSPGVTRRYPRARAGHSPGDRGFLLLPLSPNHCHSSGCSLAPSPERDRGVGWHEVTRQQLSRWPRAPHVSGSGSQRFAGSRQRRAAATPAKPPAPVRRDMCGMLLP